MSSETLLISPSETALKNIGVVLEIDKQNLKKKIIQELANQKLKKWREFIYLKKKFKTLSTRISKTKDYR